MKVVLGIFIFAATIFAYASAAEQVLGVIAPTDAILGMTTVQKRFRFGQVVTADYIFTVNQHIFVLKNAQFLKLKFKF